MTRETMWMVKCTDRKGNDVGPLREQNMVGHMDYIKGIVQHIAMAGPLKDDSGKEIVGSLLVYHTDNLDQARAWLEGDPYAKSGIWETVEWSRLVLAAGTLVGGVTW